MHFNSHHDVVGVGHGRTTDPFGSVAHQPDEGVGVDDMIDSAKVMALTLADLLV